MTEAEFQGAVIEYAQLQGWLAAHFRPAQTARGWRTPVAGDGEGFPDLVLVRGDRLIFAELKGDRGKLREAQERWLRALGIAAAAHTVERRETRDAFDVVVWRPQDWPEIERQLAR